MHASTRKPSGPPLPAPTFTCPARPAARSAASCFTSFSIACRGPMRARSAAPTAVSATPWGARLTSFAPMEISRRRRLLLSAVALSPSVSAARPMFSFSATTVKYRMSRSSTSVTRIQQMLNDGSLRMRMDGVNFVRGIDMPSEGRDYARTASRLVRGCFRDRTRRGDGGSRADGEELPEQADPPGGAVLGGRRRRHPRAHREPEARRELGAVGGDREPNGRRRQARRNPRRQGSARRPYAALDQLRVYHQRGAVFGPPVRSAQGLCRYLLHRNRYRRGSRVANAGTQDGAGIHRVRPGAARERFSWAPPAPAAQPT